MQTVARFTSSYDHAYREAAAIRLKVEPQSVDTGIAVYELAFVYMQQERFEKASILFQSAIEIFSVHISESELARIFYLKCQNSRAFSLCKLGEIHEAFQTFHPQKYRWDVFGKSAALEDILSVGMLASNLYSLGFLEKALDLFEIVAASFDREKQPLDWAKAQFNMANVLNSLDRSDKATHLYLDIKEIIRGSGDKVLEVGWINNLANTLAASGSRAAIDLYSEARDIIASDRGGIHVEYAKISSNLASAKAKFGELDDPTSEFLKCETIFTEAGSGDSLEASAVSVNLGFAFDQSGDYPEALQRYKHALKMRREKAGHHPATALVLNNIGHICAVQKDFKIAQSVCREAFLMVRNRLPSTSLLVRTVANNLALFAKFADTQETMLVRSRLRRGMRGMDYDTPLETAAYGALLES